MKDPEKEIISRALRRSRSDPTLFTFKCPSCLQHFQKPFRWLERHNGVCPSCGANLNQKEFTEFLIALAKRVKTALEAVQRVVSKK